MNWIKCCLAAMLTATSMGRASDWFVSTNGNGNGSIGSPWSLQTAITSSATVHAGDTIWLRGGTYFPTATWDDGLGDQIPGWEPTIAGATNNWITLRSYTNEWAAIDRRWQICNGGAAWIKFRNLEFYDSNKGWEPGGNTNGPWNQFSTPGPGFEWVNCVVHDIDNGAGGGLSMRGCIVWYVGWTYAEHVTYPAPPDFSGNISGWQWGTVVQHSPATLNMHGNIIFGGGNNKRGVYGPSAFNATGDCLIDGGGVVVSNYFYNRVGFVCTNGWPATLYGLAGNTFLSNNVIVGIYPVIYDTGISNSFNSRFQNNTVYANNTNVEVTAAAPVVEWFGSAGTSTFDYNDYYSAPTVTFLDLFTGLTFAQWQAGSSGFDTHSTAHNASTPPDSVQVIPNQDQPKRCHIAVYNFSHADNVAVSLSGVLNAGDSYKLISAQNYLAGPIRTGIYNGTSITVPMTNLTTAPVLYGTNMNAKGEIAVQPPPTSPEFGAFVVIGSANSTNPPSSSNLLIPPTGLHVVSQP
jgi:hypothetical protein